MPEKMLAAIPQELTIEDLWEDYLTVREYFRELMPDTLDHEILRFLSACQTYHDESYGYLHDINMMQAADLRLRVITIRRRIKKFFTGDYSK